MGRYEQLKARHERASARVGIVTPAADDGRKEQPHGIARRWWYVIALAVALAVALVVFLLPGRRTDDTALAVAARSYREAVGLVLAIEGEADADGALIPFATAWALQPDVFITNAHVAEAAMELADQGYSIVIMVNRRPDLVFKVHSVQKHSLYRDAEDWEKDPEGTGLAYDVAALHVEGKAPKTFSVAPRHVIEGLGAGDRVAYLGFPMENLFQGGVSVRSPVAVMQSGIITAVSDFRQEDAGPGGNTLIRHNLGLTGGASGSPLFNASGHVVGILNAANMTLQILDFDTETGPVIGRTPSAAMINFAQRADLIEGLGPVIPLLSTD